IYCICPAKQEVHSSYTFLKNAENRDGAVLLHRMSDDEADDRFEAHVLEIKITITHQTWSKAKVQMRWSLHRLMAIAGTIGARVGRVRCYTAFRDDELSPLSSPDPAMNKLPIGDESPVAETDEAIRS